MASKRKTSAGVTVLEVLLVIVVGAAIIYMGARQYLVYRLDADVQETKNTVDMLFQGMGRFITANCSGTYDGTKTAPSQFNPNYVGPVMPNTVVSIKTDLIDGGYLEKYQPINSIVAHPTSNWYSGYVIQFNKQTVDRYVCIKSSGTSGAYGVSGADNCALPKKMGTIVAWMPQVAVLINNPAKSADYLHLLGGDCLSSPSGTGAITPCVPGSIGSGTYVVFERNPLFAGGLKNNSPTWSLNPLVRQFKDMYTSYQVNYLIDSGGAAATGGGGTGKQYFICGG